MIVPASRIADDVLDGGPADGAVGAIAVDLRLDEEAMWPDGEYTDLPSYIKPGEMIVAVTMERLDVPRDLMAVIAGRSSDMRRGLWQPTGFVKPGFTGRVNVELANVSKSNCGLSRGDRICQLVFVRVDGLARPYDGQYQDQEGPRR